MVIDGHDEAIVIAFDVEYHSFARNDARGAKLSFEFCRILPCPLFDFGIPSVKMPFHTCSKPAIYALVHESVEEQVAMGIARPVVIM